MKHVMLLKTKITSKQIFYDDLSKSLKARSSSALIFIHGYNVSFDDAARRTAVLAHDLNFIGVPIFFSWPSKAKVLGYTADEQTIQASEKHLVNFLTTFLRESNVKKVFLIAHSMGNRALISALKVMIEKDPSIASKIAEIILTAPDIDSEIFEDIIPSLTSTAPTTLYASSNDKALWASKRVHSAPRAGDAGPNLVVLPGLDTIDASMVDTDFLGHSYFAEESPLIHDMAYLIDGIRPDKRHGLSLRNRINGSYWEFNQ